MMAKAVEAQRRRRWTVQEMLRDVEDASVS